LATPIISNLNNAYFNFYLYIFQFYSYENLNREIENENKDFDSNENPSENIITQTISQGGIAAAGFKKFIKKSISIKIKANEQMNKIDTDDKSKEINSILKSKHINKIRQPSKINLDDVKRKDNDNETKSQYPSSDSETSLKAIQQNKNNQNEETNSEKLRTEYNKAILISSNNNNMVMINQNHQKITVPYSSPIPIMNLNLSVPPPTFNYPPSVTSQQISRSANNSLLYPPPSHLSQLQNLSHVLNTSYASNNYLLVNQSIQNYHSVHANIPNLGSQIISRNLNQNMNNINNNKNIIDEDVEEFNLYVNDDAAYDFDENENMSDLTNEFDESYNFEQLNDLNEKNYKKRSKNKKSSKCDINELDELNELIHDNDNEDVIKNKKERSRKSRKSNKHKKNEKEKHINDNYNNSNDEPDLGDIKHMLKNVLKMRINDLENENDKELKDTMENILKQVIEDESLTFDDYSSIHQTVMSLIDLEQNEYNEDSREGSQDLAIETEKECLTKRKRRREENSKKKQTKEYNIGIKNIYKPNDASFKKRKYQNNDINLNSFKSKYDYSQADKNSIKEFEIEAGEIEDM
jgi:hypothetical protein